MKPLGIDLFCGLGGWSEGLLAEGYDVVGFDNEQHVYGEARYPAQLVIQDVLTLHGSQFRDAALIVASPPCQEYSYMAMPWSRAKAIAAEYRSGVRDVADLTRLFDACFRIQREACAASGRHIPMVVENVKGAQPWVGRAAWHYGSFFLWGDVPALMPARQSSKGFGGSWFAQNHNTNTGGKGNPVDGTGVMQYDGGLKTVGHINKRDGHTHTRHLTNQRESDAVKNGNDWFGSGENCSLQRQASSRSSARKAASAQIAKIPLDLARYIARCYKN